MRIVSFIVCDDIRREIGGKNTLVGVYDDLNISVQPGKTLNWPLHIKLGFFARISNEKRSLDADKYEFTILQDGQQIASLSEAVKLQQNAQVDNVNLAIVVNSLGILKPGKLDFVIRFFKQGELLEEMKPDSLNVKVATVPQPRQT